MIDRVKGCKEVFAKNPDIKILCDDQDAKGSREGGMNVMQSHLTRYDDIAAVFTINDPQAIGSDLAAKQINRNEHHHHLGRRRAGHRGRAQAATPWSRPRPARILRRWRRQAVEIGYGIMNGEKPAETMILMPSS